QLPGTERPRERVGVQDRFRRDVEGATGIADDGEPVGLADVERVDGLEAEPSDVRNDRDCAVPRKQTREQRPEEVAPLLLCRAALEDQAGPEPHDASLWTLGLEAIQQSLHLRLVAGVEARWRALGRPALVH